MKQVRESRPGNGTRTAEISSGDKPSLPASAVNVSAIGLVSGVHVIVVETPAGKYRRRVFLSLDSAQKAADRAIMAGHPAQLILCQLMPVNGGAL